MLPPLAATAHATLVLRASALNPHAEPFQGSPGGSVVRLCFSDSEPSLSDPEESPVSGRGKAMPDKRRRRRGRCRPRHRRAASEPRQPSSAPRRLASVVVHPARMAIEPDADGFREVQSRRRWRRALQPRRPVPANLVGKCFNCLSGNHVKADCSGPARCFNCLEPGHQARDCPLPLRWPPGDHKRGRSPPSRHDQHGDHHKRGRSPLAAMTASVAVVPRHATFLRRALSPVAPPPPADPRPSLRPVPRCHRSPLRRQPGAMAVPAPRRPRLAAPHFMIHLVPPAMMLMPAPPSRLGPAGVSLRLYCAAPWSLLLLLVRGCGTPSSSSWSYRAPPASRPLRMPSPWHCSRWYWEPGPRSPRR